MNLVIKSVPVPNIDVPTLVSYVPLELMTAISTYADLVQAAAIVPGPLMAAMLTPATSILKGKLQQIKLNLDNFKSNNSFTI